MAGGGARAFADHATTSEGREQPVRAIRDLVGFYREARGGRGGLAGARATLQVLPQAEWVAALVRDGRRWWWECRLTRERGFGLGRPNGWDGRCPLWRVCRLCGGSTTGTRTPTTQRSHIWTLRHPDTRGHVASWFYVEPDSLRMLLPKAWYRGANLVALLSAGLIEGGKRVVELVVSRLDQLAGERPGVGRMMAAALGASAGACLMGLDTAE